MPTKYAFLDLDGTLIENIPYNCNPDLIQLKPGAIELLQDLNTLGFKLHLVTNQSGIGRKYFTEVIWLNYFRVLQSDLERAVGAQLSLSYCPHTPEDNCFCRKPLTGMIPTPYHADSIMIGDSPCDQSLAFALMIRYYPVTEINNLHRIREQIWKSFLKP